MNTGSSKNARASAPAIARHLGLDALAHGRGLFVGRDDVDHDRPQASRSTAASEREIERVSDAVTIGARPGIGEAMRMS